MVSTALAMCQNIQNSVMAYTQSDEISFLLADWESHGTQQWFGGKIQKMCSVAGSLATANFIQFAMMNNLIQAPVTQANAPLFDARVYNVPREEVVNYFIWRQQDASRNSVQMLGRSYFSHTEMHKKNNAAIQDMLMDRAGVNWNDCETWQKRGTCIGIWEDVEDDVDHHRWITDQEIPIFTQDREYIERHMISDASSRPRDSDLHKGI